VKQKAYSRGYYCSNKGLSNANKAKRRAALLQRTPSWLSPAQLKEISALYELAKELQWLSEEPLHVDHIEPLQGSTVSGLHVPWNLQILPESLNLAKGNRR
jgi:5-methylcytosine-specific restriction endonuclease McrA